MFYFLSFCLFVFCCCFCFSTREKFGGWASKVLSFYVVFVLLSFGLFLCWHEISWDVGRAAGLKTKKFLQSNCNFWHVTWNLFKVVSIKQKSLWGFSASEKLICTIFSEKSIIRAIWSTLYTNLFPATLAVTSKVCGSSLQEGKGHFLDLWIKSPLEQNYCV